MNTASNNRRQLSLDTFEQWIDEVVDCHYEKIKKGDREGKWKASKKNSDIKKTFHKKMIKRPDLRFASRYSGKCLTDPNKGERNQEFLYDFSWVKWGEDEDGNNVLKDILMVMELEFSDAKIGKGKLGNIKYDFNKLLQADAPYKLMGFQMPDQDDVDNAIKEMKRAVEAYHSKVHAEILIFAWAWAGEKTKDGHRQFQFTQLHQTPNLA